MKKNYILLTISSILILLFLYASFSKIFEISQFKRDMFNQPFPHWLSNIFLYLIPGTEIAICVLLILDRFRTKGLVAAAILMGLFTLYTGAILFHLFKYIPCSCGGVIKLLSWRQHLFFNLFFLLISIIALILNKQIGISIQDISRAKSGFKTAASK